MSTTTPDVREKIERAPRDVEASRGIRSSSQLTRAGCLVLASRSKYQDTTLVSTR